ncbi:MAG: hypothetical protein COT91_00690 [Candidatus Doudnabacteria bacterium CG10_big_fil_rev_8_21_14_0_10_41_10]|uniref:Methyltransferase type 11 domain-containing protein n=1 Tax=Candidatus Doudnabacteria bacterium CG10_big_fil_rev_8_21_14_0_10_41_10 TaxID=1974551 RepID=A0A2H0VGU5_9BACT|nr:MAG: hypothetical protein COT91_00690 [Candidatus Doudnabacteria bacterium CG10_big_fil_rev_8_21_14_0_10_41_10]
MKVDFFILFSQINKEIKKIFSNKNEEVLDVGCGSKPRYHSCIKGKITCFDALKSEITDVVGDADKLQQYFGERKFNKIISVNSLYQFRDPKNVVAQMHSLLASFGTLVLVVPFMYPLHDIPHDRYRFSEYGIRELMANKFDIKKIKPIGGMFNLPAMVLHSAVKALSGYYKKLPVITWILAVPLYLLYLLAQIFSLLDFFDRSGRFVCLYLVVASKN